MSTVINVYEIFNYVIWGKQYLREGYILCSADVVFPRGETEE